MRALILGCTGQDGSYLCEYLLDLGYEVHGVIRRSSTFNTGRIDHIFDRLHLHYGDITDPLCMVDILKRVEPTEVYNLAAMSHVRVSFDAPWYTGQTVAQGALCVLEAVRLLGMRGVRIYQASSSEMFGNAPAPQNESTPLQPCSPYAVAKAYAYWMSLLYRNGHDVWVSNGILFNHESERRGETFVTRKITRAVGRIKYGLQDRLLLGYLYAKRDWGHAEDYVKAMHLMLQQGSPDDYVIGTGATYSVHEFVKCAFGRAGLDHAEHVGIDERYIRPTEIDELRADATKAREVLGWRPRVTFDELVRRMVDHDMGLAASEAMQRHLLNG